MQWSCFQSVEFNVEELEFARGGFRAAFKATSMSLMFLGKQLIIKHYLPETLKTIQSVNETTEIHARKSVQMMALAGNLASQLSKVVDTQMKQYHFGKTFRYVDAYLGRIPTTNEIVTIEEFAGENFTKYVNNNGLLASGNDVEMQQKAECLVHFSFVKSKGKLMLTDIQGSDHCLTDPEIATIDGSFDQEELLFCVGNLGDEATNNFFESHTCNTFCEQLALESDNKNNMDKVK